MQSPPLCFCCCGRLPWQSARCTSKYWGCILHPYLPATRARLRNRWVRATPFTLMQDDKAFHVLAAFVFLPSKGRKKWDQISTALWVCVVARTSGGGCFLLRHSCYRASVHTRCASAGWECEQHAVCVRVDAPPKSETFSVGKKEDVEKTFFSFFPPFSLPCCGGWSVFISTFCICGWPAARARKGVPRLVNQLTTFAINANFP